MVADIAVWHHAHTDVDTDIYIVFRFSFSFHTDVQIDCTPASSSCAHWLAVSPPRYSSCWTAEPPGVPLNHGAHCTQHTLLASPPSFSTSSLTSPSQLLSLSTFSSLHLSRRPFPLFPAIPPSPAFPHHLPPPLPPLPPSHPISVAVGSLFKCSIGEGLRFMQGQCGMW